MEEEKLKIEKIEKRKIKNYEYAMWETIRFFSLFFTGRSIGEIFRNIDTSPDKIILNVAAIFGSLAALVLSIKKTSYLNEHRYDKEDEEEEEKSINNGKVIKNPLPPKNHSSK
jgi:hypothetical protein